MTNERSEKSWMFGVSLFMALVLGGCDANLQEQNEPGSGFAAVPGLVGGHDIFGPYEVVPNWPKPMSESLPGHENWTYSVTMDVFAESPDRILVASQGELPLLNRGEMDTVKLTDVAPSLLFPINRLPLRQAGAGVPRVFPTEYDQESDRRGRVEGVWTFDLSIISML